MNHMKLLENDGWMYASSSKGFVLKAPSKTAAQLLMNCAEDWLQAIAQVWGEVLIKWDGCRRGYKFMAEKKAAINSTNFEQVLAVQQVFGAEQTGLTKPVIDVLATMVESERPMSLVRMSDDRQLWVNEPMVQLQETTPAEAVTRCMVDFWLPGDLEDLKQKVRQCNEQTGFFHKYQAGLSPQTWAKLEGHFDRIPGGFRRSTTYTWEVIPKPAAIV